MDDTRIDRWHRRLSVALDALDRIGAEVELSSRRGQSTGDALREAAAQVGRPLHSDLARVLSALNGLHGMWRLPESLEERLPHPSGDVVWGTVNLSPGEVVAAETSRQTWVRECFANPDDPYDRIWHHKFAFHTVANGDCLAIADHGHGEGVYYLSHDDGEGHGYQLAPSFEDFIERWSLLAFAGPEDWLLLPFMPEPAAGLDSRGDVARDWRKALGLTDIEGV